MKQKKSRLLLLSILVILSVVIPAVSASAAIALFHTTYTYGIQVADDPTLIAKYNSWVSYFVTSGGANGYRRVQYPEGLTCSGSGATASEGIGYAMLLAVWFNDQTLFNDLWNYKTTVSPKSALMAWCVNSGGGVVDQNSATDADVDIAMALILANRRWGSAGAFNYNSLATTEVNKISANDICSSDFRVYPGDYCACASGDNTYPSYFTPAWYTEFGLQTGNATFWGNVRSKSAAMLAYGRNATSGLDTEQVSSIPAATAGTKVGSDDGYNSARIPWRYGLDYTWNGDATSLGQLNLNASFFAGKSGTCGAVYNASTNAVVDGTHNGMRIGPAGCAMMSNASRASELALYYTQASTACGDSTHFYNATLALLACIQETGNTPRLFGTPQPTPTPRPGDLFDDCEDGDNVDLWGGYWYTYDDNFNANFGNSYVVPCSVSKYTSVGQVPTPYYMQAPGLGAVGISDLYAARMTGNVTTTYTYGFVGMGAGTAPDSGAPTFQARDVSGYTGIRFKMKAGNGTYQYDFKLKCGSWAVTKTGDNDYKYTFTGTTYTSVVDVPFIAFTQAPGWGIFVDKLLIEKNLTDLQWQTNGQPHPGIDIWVDDIEFYPAKPPTPTPTYCTGELLDNLEDGNNTNQFGGAWYTYKDTGASTVVPASGSAFTDTAPGANASAWCAGFTGNVANVTNSFVGMGTNMSVVSTTAKDMHLFVGVTFWAKATSLVTYAIKLKATSGVNTGLNEWKYTFNVDTAGNWEQFVIPFSLFTQERGWGITVPLATVLTNLMTVQFESRGLNHAVGLSIDDVYFNCSQGWTPTRTPVTGTPSFTPTYTRTPPPTSSFTPTFTRTITFSPTSTRTNTIGTTFTYTQTFTNTSTRTATATYTRTPTPTSTRTTTIVITNTFTMTFTCTSSRTATPTSTVPFTSTHTRTSTIVITSTFTPTFTSTFTRSVTPTYTSTPSVTPTWTTAIGSFTFTPSISATFTRSATPTFTPTFTQTRTRTFTPSATNTVPDTYTATSTRTQTIGNSPTFTNTVPGTFTFTPTRTVTPSFTRTSTTPPTATNTNTIPAPTSTFTNTIPAPTATNTTGTSPCLFDDMENNDTQNIYGGYWYSYLSADTSVPANVTVTAETSIWPEAGGSCSPSAGGALATAYAMRMTGTVGAINAGANVYPCIGIGSQLNATAGSPAFTETDISSCTGIRFYTKGNSDSYLIKIPYTDAGGNNLTGYDDYKYVFTAPAAWSALDIPFTSFAQAGWGTAAVLSTVLTHAKEFQWQSNFNGTPGAPAAVDLWIDEVYLYGCASCPTPPVPPTPVNTPVNTNTQANTPVVTFTNTPQATFTSTLIPTLTITPTLNTTGGSLSASIVAAPSTVSVGDNITVVMSVQANGIYDMDNVIPSALLPGGTGTIAYVSGPTPAALYIAQGATSDFTWVYLVTGAGSITLQGDVSGNDTTYFITVTSPSATSAAITAVNPTPTAANTSTRTRTSTPTPTFTRTSTITRTYTPTVTPTTDTSGGILVSGITITGPGTVTVGQDITVVMNVNASGSHDVNNVAPSALTPGGSGTVNLVSGPSPGSASISAGSSQDYTWVYNVASAGSINFNGNASGTDALYFNPISSMASTSMAITAFNATPTLISTLVPTPSYTSTELPTAVDTETSTPGSTMTYTATVTPTIAVTTTVNTVTDPKPYPNPYDPNGGDPLHVSFNVSRGCVSVKFEVWTSGMRKIKSLEQEGSFGPGTVELDIASTIFRNFANGTYYYVILATDDNGQVTRSKIDKILIIRKQH